MLDYSAALSLNNDRSWFHANHKQYEEARKDFYGLLEMLRYAIADAVPALAEDIIYMDVRSWAYRVARDMRYHRNRPPYDPAFRAYIAPDRRSWKPTGYFIRLFPGESRFGTGLWCDSTEDMNRIRDHIAENHSELRELTEESGLIISGESLKKAPRGYDENHPAIEWIKLKSWSVMQRIGDEHLTSAEELCEYAASLAAKMEPIRQFLLKACDPGAKQFNMFF